MSLKSTIKKELLGIALDRLRDSTGNYSFYKVGRINSTSVTRKPPPNSIKKYGMNRWDYWALGDKQKWCCAICGSLQGKRALHVDHCHETNKIRGLLCHGCNIAIGQIKNSADTARAIAAYLDLHQS